MANADYCFFCCNYIPKEDDSINASITEDANSFKAAGENEKSNNIKKSILEISHYLKVPREVIKEDEHIFPSINICPVCTEISKKLGDCCVQLELIKMKISHYLNLLTDQIIGISTEQNNEKRDWLQSTFSDLQKLVHKNCLLKVRKDEETSSPQIRVPKSSIPIIIPTELPEETTADIKLENSLMNSCPFCDFTTTGPYEIIHSHIEAQHPEQIQPEQEETDTSFDGERKLTKSSEALQCTICGNSFQSRGGLNRHSRDSASCGDGSKRKSLKIYKDRYECSICKRRFSRRENVRRHLRTICKTGTAIDHGPEELDVPQKFVTEKETKFPCSFCPIIFNNSDNQKRHIETCHVNQKTSSGQPIKACEYCGAMMGPASLRKHLRNIHGVGKFGPDKNLIKKYEQCSCGKFVSEKNMAVHKNICEKKGKEANEKLERIRIATIKKPRKKYYYEKKPPIKCEVCGKMIGYRNMSAHKKNVHKINLYRW